MKTIPNLNSPHSSKCVFPIVRTIQFHRLD